ADWLKNDNHYASHNLPLRSLTGEAIATDKTLICEDLEKDSRVHRGSPDFFAENGIRSFVSIPIHFTESELGALNLYNNTEPPLSGFAIAAAEAFAKILPGVYSGLREKDSLKLISTLNSIAQRYEGHSERLKLATAKAALAEMAKAISEGFR